MFSPQSLVLQLAYALLVAAMLSARLTSARRLVAVAAAIGLAYGYWSGDLVTLAWMGILLSACLVMLLFDLRRDRGIAFSAEEGKMVDRLFRDLPKRTVRHLLDRGLWLNGREGDQLTREGEPVRQLYYLASGSARVISQNRQVGACRSGDLIGEITILSGEAASATVILDQPARFWCAPAEDLRPYVEAHDDVRRALERGFAASLQSKLRASNRNIAEAGGIAASA